MRESIGGAWILGIVMTFIVMFTSFLAMSINYSKAFKVKNNIVDLIEKNEGMNEDAAEDIYGYLQTEGYILKGKCPIVSSGQNVFVGFDNTHDVGAGEDALYCVQSNKVDGELDKAYYSVRIFFRLDLPILSEVLTFRVSGETMSIFNPDNGGFKEELNVTQP